MSGESNAVLNTIIGAALGFGAAVFAEPLRRWVYRPKLELTFGNDLAYQTNTPEAAQPLDAQTHTVHEAYYIRIRVKNTKPTLAKHCLAYLIAVEKEDEAGQFQPTIYCDSIPLSWACRDSQAYEPLDLPNGVNQFIDVVSTREISQDFRLEIRPKPYRYINLFKEHGTFRFSIQVSGENVKPTFINIVFRWSGVWDNYEARLDKCT